MEIKIKRITLADEYTVGNMFIDGNYICDTLEDKVRPITSIKDKVYGRTAIPAGTYTVVMDYSSHFKCLLPHILDVPFFSGIRIHSGNEVEDTNGCILVGTYYRGGYITNSKDALKKVVDLISKAINSGQKITITIE